MYVGKDKSKSNGIITAASLYHTSSSSGMITAPLYQVSNIGETQGSLVDIPAPRSSKTKTEPTK